VPLGVLKAGDIAFTPDLPSAIRTAVDRLGMGRFLKAVMRFPDRVWPGGMDWLGRIGEPTFPEFVDLRAVTGESILVGFATGADAERLEELADDGVVGEALAALRAAIGATVPAPTHALVTRWGQDPFARGSYSFMAVGATPDDRDALAEPLSPHVILAGEAVSRRHPSTVRGAWESGEAAVDRLLSDPT
jgi:monoamine oxidase